MATFIIGLIILWLGYIFYSRYVEHIFGPDDRPTPANELNDGVDFVPISKNRNALIHLLNIAGMGPIIGAVQGILFGPHERLHMHQAQKVFSSRQFLQVGAASHQIQFPKLHKCCEVSK